MSDRCSACPVAEGAYCASGHHPRYCELAAIDRAKLEDDPSYDPYYLRWLADNTTPPPSAVRVEPGPDATARRDAKIAQLHEQRLLVLSCDYRGPQDGQGCNCRNVCFARKGRFEPHLASMSDCLECVTC